MEIASEHKSLTGNYREEMWMKFFRSIIPRKYSMAQNVMIIDSNGNVSNEVDIAVFDEQYTPYVFQYNTLKFIPIEAVSIVIECKSRDLKENQLKTWSQSIDNLETKNSGIARIVTGYVSGLTNKTQVKTRPIKILTCIKQNKSDKPLEKLEERLGDDFDFIIQKQQGMRTTFQVLIKNEDKSLAWWGTKLNGVGNEQNDRDPALSLEHFSIGECKDEEKLKKIEKCKCLVGNCSELKFDENFYLTNTLSDLKVTDNPFLSLNLQLNQLLMLVNNPMLFPHFAYAKAFDKIIKQVKGQEEQKVKVKSE